MELTGELLDLVRGVDWLPTTEPPVARLWAKFLDPKRYGVPCIGFDLRADTKSNGHIMFRAQRGHGLVLDSGAPWGSALLRYSRVRSRRDELAIHIHRQSLKSSFNHNPVDLDRRRVEALAAEGRETARVQRVATLNRAIELAGQRVMVFVGDPDAQMMSAGSLAAIYARCGQALTDPESLKRGIGPECWPRLGHAAQMRFAAALAVMRSDSKRIAVQEIADAEMAP